MRTLPFRSVAVLALLLLPRAALIAQDPRVERPPATFTAEELDNLVAPVALYPDPLLAQILIAATFPDQVAVAARYVRERGTRGIDDESWDISVKAVAHYPPVLNLLAEQEDWSTALDQAYAAQSGDVMDAVQRLRAMAQAQGNLVSTREQTVSVQAQRIIIVPANPQVIYVPTYDPDVVFFRPIFSLGFRTPSWSFGIGFPIGAWLVYDFDWYGRRIYYDGWQGGGWRIYARPYIHYTPVYVHPRYRTIHININIFSRRVNYVNLDRYHRNIHREVTYVRRDRDRYSDRYIDRPGDRYGDRGGNRSGDRNGDGRRGNDDGRGVRGDQSRPGDRRDDARDVNRTATFGSSRPDRGAGRVEDRKGGTSGNGGGFGAIDRRSAPVPPRAPLVIRGGANSPRIPQATGGGQRQSGPSTFSSSAKVKVATPSVRPSARVQVSKPPKAESQRGAGGKGSSPRGSSGSRGNGSRKP